MIFYFYFLVNVSTLNKIDKITKNKKEEETKTEEER